MPKKMPQAIEEAVLRGVAPALRNASDSLLGRVERERGAYASHYRHAKRDDIENRLTSAVLDQVRLAWKIVGRGLSVPNEPRELKKYEAACSNHDYLSYRGRVGPESAPKKPKKLIRYQKELAQLARAFEGSAEKAGVGWTGKFLEKQGTVVLESLPRRRASIGSRTKPNRGVSVKPQRSLVGEKLWKHPEDSLLLTADAARSRLEKYMSDIVGRPLVFAEEIGIAERERRNESDQHRRMISEMVGVLVRQSYEVYPGGVGLQGIYAMADLLAISPEGNPLFVECLTKWSIERAHHFSKLDLAKVVPFCFVGELPKEFVSGLPRSAYALEYPKASKTANGVWVPEFYRSAEYRDPTFLVKMRVGRKKVALEFAFPGLRLKEDVASFLWAALGAVFFASARPGVQYLATVGKGSGETELRYPRSPVHSIPFERTGITHSTFRLVENDLEIKVKLGSQPVVAELYGGYGAFERLRSLVTKAGFGLEVI